MTGNTSQKLSRIKLLVIMAVVSVMIVPLAFSGAAVADKHDVELEDGNIHWEGQVIQFTDASVSEGDELVLRVNESEDSSLESQLVADSNGAVYINTSNLQNGSGNYVLNDSDSNALAEFEVATQNLTVEVEDDSVVNASTGSDNQTTFEFESNRSTYDVYVSEESDEFDADELDDIFQDGSVVTVDDEDKYQIQSPNDVEAVFADIDAGDYNFEFDVVDSNASDSVSLQVRDIGSVDASFRDSPYTSTVGDIAEYTVDVENTDMISLQIGDDDDIGYQYNFDVDVSENYESEVTILFNTAIAGNEVVPVMLEDDSDGEIVNANPDQELSQALDSGSYQLRISADGSTQDVTNLRLVNRSTDDSTVHTAPLTENITELEDIEEYATETDQVAVEDKILFEVNATGIYAALDENRSASDLAEGSTFANENGIYVTIEQVDPQVNRGAKTLDVSQGELITDSENGQFFLVFNTTDLNVEEDEEYELTFTVDENNPYVEDEGDEDNEETVSSEVTFNERMVEFDGLNEDDVVVVENTDETVVTATTTVAPQTEVRGVAEATGENAFFRQQPVDTSEDRTLEFTFDMSDVDDGVEFELFADGFSDSRVDAITSTGETVSDVTVDVVDSESEDVMTDFEVELIADDGFVVETAETSDEGTVILEGVEDGSYTVEPASEYYEGSADVEVESEDVSVTLEVTELPTYDLTVSVEDEEGNPVQNAQIFLDGDELTVEDSSAQESVLEGDYSVSASADGYEDASEDVTVSEDTEITLTLTEEVDETEGPDETGGEDENGEEVETEGQPGFGVFITLIALLGAGLLAARRRNE